MIANAIALQRYFHDWLLNLAALPKVTKLRTCFGEHGVEITFHDPELASAYGRALKHSIPSASAATILNLHVVAQDSSGLSLPKLGWDKTDFSLKRVVPGWCDNKRTTFLLRTEKGICLINWEDRLAFVWLPSHRNIPWWERAAPFRWLADQLAQRLGMCTLHCGVVSKDGHGVLFAGPAGAGKSTLTLACVGHGLDYVGDDYCLFEYSSEPTCFNLYSSAKWSIEAAVRPSWLSDQLPHEIDESGAKAVLYIDELPSRAIAGRTRLLAVLMPRLTPHHQAGLEPASPPEALRRLAPSTIAQSEADGGFLMGHISRLVKTVPAYHLDMPEDTDEPASLVSRLISRLQTDRDRLRHDAICS